MRRVARSDVAMTSFKMTSLNFNKIKYQISNQHKFCLIVHKNNVIRIKIVEKMVLFRVFLDHSMDHPHTFVEIDHEIMSTVILLPSAESFKKGCCELQAKVCARSSG